jgi:acetyltransferase-like isoleucine patch superfamily enzyme
MSQAPSLFSIKAVQEAFNTPWKARNEIERLLQIPFAWLGFRLAGVEIAQGWSCYGLPILQVHRQSRLKIGANASFRSSVYSNPLGVNHACLLCTWSIVCAEKITIGNRVFMGANSTITDTDFHPIEAATRNERPADGATAPITIGDDVFIGMNCLILKGVSIGSGVVIGAGSVVTKDIPAGVVAAGNPAKVIREL